MRMINFPNCEGFTYFATKPDFLHHNLIDKREEPESCLCFHYPIRECCVIRNKYNYKEEVVGNCCIRMFETEDSARFFQSLKRVRKDPSRSLSSAVMEYAWEQDVIDEWKFDFYIDIRYEHEISRRQMELKSRINPKVLEFFTKEPELLQCTG